MKRITTPLNAIAVFTGFQLAILFYWAYQSVTHSASYYAELERQLIQQQAQLDDYDRQTKVVDELQSDQKRQNTRFNKILDKWDAQACRQDLLLDAAEKRNRNEL